MTATTVLEWLDVRTKTLVFGVVLVAVFVFSDPLYNFALFALLLTAALAARTPLKGLRTMMQPLIPLFLLIAVLTMFTRGGQQFVHPQNEELLFAMGPLDATLGGLLTGLNFVMRILLMVLATYLFTAFTPIDDIILAMNKVHAPYWLSILVTTAISFIPTMDHKRALIVEAQRARGAQARRSGMLGQLMSFVPIMVPLMTNSLIMADNLAIAMTNRGYGARPSITTLRDLRFQARDGYVMAVAGHRTPSLIPQRTSRTTPSTPTPTAIT